MIVGKSTFAEEPVWYLNDKVLENVKQLNLLGVCFQSDMKSDSHVSNRISKARGAIFRYSGTGVCYPGLASDVKTYIWNTVGVPSLTYGLDCIDCKSRLKRSIETAQSSTIKSQLGLSKFSHSTPILAALDIPKVSEIIERDTQSLFHRIFKVNSPVRDLNVFLVAKQIVTGSSVKGTLVDRIMRMGLSPTGLIASGPATGNPTCDPRVAGQAAESRLADCGLVDSLRYVLLHEDYNKPHGTMHHIAKLLTKVY